MQDLPNVDGAILPKDNSDNEQSDNTSDISSVKSIKRDFKCCQCGEEVLYGLTLFGRLIMTLYSFHAMLFIYNFVIELIILIPEILYLTNSVAIQILIILLFLMFSIFASSILVIPTYEVFLFPFLRYRNVLAHLESLKKTMYIIYDIETEKINLKRNNFIADGILVFVEISYFIGFCCGFSSNSIKTKDVIRVIIFCVVYCYFLVIFFSYLFVSIGLYIKIISTYENNKCSGIFKSFIELDEKIKFLFDKKTSEENKEKEVIPNLSLFSYVINPLLEKSYEIIDKDASPCCCCYCCPEKHCWYKTKNIIMLVIAFCSFFITLVICFIYRTFWNILLYFILFVLMLILSLMVNFPFVIRNKNTNNCCGFFSPKNIYGDKYKMKHPRMVSFIRLICFSICLLISGALIYTFYHFGDDSDSLKSIKEKAFTPYKEQSQNILLPNICYSPIHKMKLSLYLPFINDAYYFDDNTEESSFGIDDYKKMFFNDNYKIKVVGNIIEKNSAKDQVKMIQYDMETPSSDKITILSIKGTSNKKDVYLDIQLYFPSVLLNLFSLFSVFSQQKDTKSFSFMEYGLSIPYRLFSSYVVIDEYLRDLLTAYYSNNLEEKENVVIVGHSLGGGLCKILGKLTNRQSISLSGPGVNAFHSLWNYKSSNENFEISSIDLVPDMDLVPRVEVSGGTIYRIICKEGPLDCHSKEISLCEVLIMCDHSNYEEYCKNVAGLNKDQIDMIKDNL